MNTSKSMRLLPLAAAILISACNNGGVLELQNRGGDRYPLESIRVSGNNPDAFVSPILGDIVLEPAQALGWPIQSQCRALQRLHRQ